MMQIEITAVGAESNYYVIVDDGVNLITVAYASDDVDLARDFIKEQIELGQNPFWFTLVERIEI